MAKSKEISTSNPSREEGHGYAWEDSAVESVNSFVLREETPANGKPFDLLERTARFGESIIRFVRKMPQNPVNNRLISQLVGAGTSIGANFCEASESVSKKDFRNCVARCKKEAKETKFFLRMIATAEPSLAEEARRLYREANELMLILASMYRQ